MRSMSITLLISHNINNHFILLGRAEQGPLTTPFDIPVRFLSPKSKLLAGGQKYQDVTESREHVELHPLEAG